METTRKQRIQHEAAIRKIQIKASRLKTIKKVTTVAGAGTLLATAVLTTQGGQALIGNGNKAAYAASYTNNSFLDQVAPTAQQLASQNNLYASVMIAQSILESGWGTSTLSAAPNYNLFGIKGNYNGQSVTLGTSEDDGAGNLYGISQTFKRYPSYAASLQDYVNKIRYGTTWNANYYSGAWKSNTGSYLDATKALTGKYATDTTYNTKLNHLIQTYNLTQYDVASTATQTSYTVQAGDTVWQIAAKFGVSIEQIATLNNLNNYFINPGDQLTLRQSASVSGPTSGHYTVQNGDRVWALALRFGITQAQLTSWNGIQNNFIYPGLDLIVSSPSSSTGTTTHKSYTVVQGDSLWRISQNNGLTINQLKNLNHMTTNMIHPGNVLYVS